MKKMSLCKHLNPAIQDLELEMKRRLFQGQPLEGNTNPQLPENLVADISSWKNRHLAQSNNLRLYGYLAWYLDISIREYNTAGIADFKNFVVMTFLSELDLQQDFQRMKNSIEKGYTPDINDWWGLHYSEYTNGSFTCYPIPQQEFSDDLTHYYNASKERFEHWKHDYPTHNNIPKLEADYAKAAGYIKRAKTNLEIVRLNKLGYGKPNDDTHYGELSMYFVMGNGNMYVIKLSDFA